MSEKTNAAIESGVANFLHPSERVYAALIASTRGHQQAMVGGIAGAVGASRAGKARATAEAVGIELASPMGFVLTSARLLTVELGNGGRVKRLLNDFALSEIGGMDVKRHGLGASVLIRMRGTDVKLESRAGAAREFAAELETVKADNF